MKKILLATTVLAMSAGFAAADVSTSGDGRMGITSTDGVMTFTNRMRIKFSGSGTTDAGLSFGGSFRAGDASLADDSPATKGSVFISGAFGKVTMGDVDSGDTASVGQLASVGFTGLGSGNSISYAADAGGDAGLPGTLGDAGGARVLYTYSAGALTINASTAQMTDGGATAYGIGGSYTSGPVTVGLGYGVVDGGSLSALKSYGTATGGSAAYTTISSAADASVTDLSLSASYVMGATTVKAIYQAKTLDASFDTQAVTTALPALTAVSISSTATSMGMSVVHKIDALSLTAYTISTEVDIADALSADNPTVSRYGVGFGYDLGGGASVTGGWATVDALTATAITAAGTAGELQEYTVSSVGTDKFDLGLNFSF
jgi:outer membrane protein OmpU